MDELVHTRESSSSQQQQHQHHSESALRLEFQIESIDLFNLRGGDIEINICQIQRDDIEWVSWVRGERWCDKNYVSSLLLWIFLGDSRSVLSWTQQPKIFSLVEWMLMNSPACKLLLAMMAICICTHFPNRQNQNHWYGIHFEYFSLIDRENETHSLSCMCERASREAENRQFFHPSHTQAIRVCGAREREKKSHNLVCE